ncbi:hypothetical protein FQZ97_640830 [compost metagenome]
MPLEARDPVVARRSLASAGRRRLDRALADVAAGQGAPRQDGAGHGAVDLDADGGGAGGAAFGAPPVVQAELRGVGLGTAVDLHLAPPDIGQRPLALGEVDAGARHVPLRGRAAGSAGLGDAAALATQPEQAVLASGQAEARKGQGVDLLLGEVGGQLGVELRRRREAAGGGGRALHAAGRLRAGFARAQAAVDDLLAGLDVDPAAGLDDGLGDDVAGGRQRLVGLQGAHLAFGDVFERYPAGIVAG